MVSDSRIIARLAKARKAGIKIKFEPGVFLADELARQIQQEIDKEILNDLLGAM